MEEEECNNGDIPRAASTLVLMREQELDPITAIRLGILVRKTLRFTLPRFPPVESLNNVIGSCSRPFEKPLTMSDVSGSQCRLSLTREEVVYSILPMLNPLREIIEDGIPVTVYDSAGKSYRMIFQSWNDSKLYVLKNGWSHFCREHELEIRDLVTVWMFRHRNTQSLCFVLTFKKLRAHD